MGLFGFKLKKDSDKKHILCDIKFAIPYFDVFDPRLLDFGVPCAVHGNMVYGVDDIDLFKGINGKGRADDELFKDKIHTDVVACVKAAVANAPMATQIPVVQIERKVMEISRFVQTQVALQIEPAYGIVVKSLNVTDILVDKSSRGYREVKALTAEFEKENQLAQHNANLSNFKLQNDINQRKLRNQTALEMEAMQRQQALNIDGQERLQRMQLENMRETMRIQREEMQRASRLQTEQTFLDAHKADLNAYAQNKAMDKGINPFLTQPQNASQTNAEPQEKQLQYMIGINGQPNGPFDWNQLKQLALSGQLTRQSLVWKQGMQSWAEAGQVQELVSLFANQAPALYQLIQSLKQNKIN